MQTFSNIFKHLITTSLGTNLGIPFLKCGWVCANTWKAPDLLHSRKVAVSDLECGIEVYTLSNHMVLDELVDDSCWRVIRQDLSQCGHTVNVCLCTMTLSLAVVMCMLITHLSKPMRVCLFDVDVDIL